MLPSVAQVTPFYGTLLNLSCASIPTYNPYKIVWILTINVKIKGPCALLPLLIWAYDLKDVF